MKAEPPARSTLGFRAGLGLFLGTGFAALARRDLRGWFRATLLRSFVAALLVWTALVAAGIGLRPYFARWIAHWRHAEAPTTGFSLDDTWGWVAAIVWAGLLLYLSGRVLSLVGAFSTNLWVDERRLVAAATGERVVGWRRVSWRDRAREIRASLVSAVAGLAVIPFFFFPVLIPLGVLLLGAALGAEAFAFGRRLHVQNSARAVAPVSLSFLAGIGLLPAIAAFFPFVAWLSLPLLQLTGFFAAQKVSVDSNRP